MSYGTPVFEPFWKGRLYYLTFLHLTDRKNDDGQSALDEALQALYTILESNPRKEIDGGIHSLLTELDWRAHLVALISLLALKPANHRFQFEMLWQRIHKGSWVSPQIVAVLQLLDSEFEKRGRCILSGEAPLEGNIRDDKLIISLSNLLESSHLDTPHTDFASKWLNRIRTLSEQGRLKIAVY
jgi:hypothetical protein